MTDSTLAQALVEAQAGMPTVAKDSTNEHFHNRFMSLDALIAATRPVLNKAGLAITQFPVTNDDTGFPVLRTVIVHGASGEQWSFETPLYVARQDMQGFGAAITYARRYAWAAALGIAAEDDTDGNTPGQPPPPPPVEDKPAPRMASKPQKAKMGVLVKELDAANMPMPPEHAGAASWVEALKQKLQQDYGVESRNDLTVEQASGLIDWLEEQSIPF